MIHNIIVRNVHDNEGVINLWQCNWIIANPESSVDLRNHKITDTVVVLLSYLTGHLMHHTLSLPQLDIETMPSPAFMLNHCRNELSRYVFGHPTTTISATAGWVNVVINGKVICIPILWFILLDGVCLFSPQICCCALQAVGETKILEINFECNHLSIHHLNGSKKDEHKIRRKEHKKSIKHDFCKGVNIPK